MEGYSESIQEMSLSLYIQEYVAGELYLVMERIDSEALFNDDKKAMRGMSELEFWRDFVKRDIASLKKLTSRNSLNTYVGADSFLLSLNSTFVENNELWVVYASTRRITTKNIVENDDIELYMTTSTSYDGKAPMITNMGIQRHSKYFKSEIYEDQRRYRGLAMPLHSFSARVMLMRYPDMSYMITCPVGNMRRLIKLNEKLKKNVFYGDNRKPFLDNVDKDSLEDIVEDKYWELDKKWRITKRKLKSSNYTKKEKINLRRELRKISGEMDDMLRYAGDTLTYKKPDLDQSPIILYEDTTEIYNKNRSIVLLKYDRNSNQVTVFRNGKYITNDAGKNYHWFFNRAYIGSEWNYVTIDLNALANADKNLSFSSSRKYNISRRLSQRAGESYELRLYHADDKRLI